jgi:predicted GNAT superfamily acetyltransferase
MLRAKDRRERVVHTRHMSLLFTRPPVVQQAEAAALEAARAARVQVGDEVTLAGFLEVEALFNTVWGLSAGETAVPAELLRSFSHAGCNVTVARAADGTVVGAAVAIVSPPNPEQNPEPNPQPTAPPTAPPGFSIYSLIAGVLPGIADRGVGFALKQHQRAWALNRGLTTMTWTFDPLVSRNARFNLTKLGAHANEYVRDFYGPMQGAINSNDESDRLVAVWPLDSARAVNASEGRPEAAELPEAELPEPEPDPLPEPEPGSVPAPDAARGIGPDGRRFLIESAGSLWCRVPDDIVALRAADPELAAAWRRSIRSTLTEAFASGHTARGVTRTGWYRLVPKELS